MAAQPPARRRKTAHAEDEDYGAGPPIVFNIQGMVPDTRFTVFDSQFYANSIVLRLYSAYFRKFLDEPGNNGSATLSFTQSGKGRFGDGDLQMTLKYDWIQISMITVRAGIWSKWLVLLYFADDDEPKRFTGDRKLEVAAFQNLLSALYNKEYKISSFDEFATIAPLADFYCMLPVISRSLNGMFFKTPDFWKFIQAEPLKMLELAVKFRHSALFNDAVIFSMSPRATPAWKNLPPGNIRSICASAHASVVSAFSLVENCVLGDLVLSLSGLIATTTTY